ncbi:MAG: archease [Thermoplasmata archaeon]
MTYKIVDHQSDIGIIVNGKTYEELFSNAVYAMADLIIDVSTLKEDKKMHELITGKSPEDIMVNLLSRVLFFIDTYYTIYYHASSKYQDGVLDVYMYGTVIPENAEYKNVIKAVTYDELEVKPQEGFAKVIFDL